MATEGGAAALGMAGRAGRIQAGYVADMVRVDARRVMTCLRYCSAGDLQ